jgi:hypothetical protein
VSGGQTRPREGNGPLAAYPGPATFRDVARHVALDHATAISSTGVMCRSGREPRGSEPRRGLPHLRKPGPG